MNVSQAVALRIKELLKDRNVTQYALARAACISRDTLKSIMKNKAKGVNLKTLIAISDGFGITVSEFLDSELFLYDNLNMD